MTEIQAKDVLVKRLTDAGKSDAEQLAQDLIDWYNCTELTIGDVKRLGTLALRGRFKAWYCLTCGDRIQYGDPTDWGHFQGVRQPDYVSYPNGSRFQCNSCRCHKPTKDD